MSSNTLSPQISLIFVCLPLRTIFIPLNVCHAGFYHGRITIKCKVCKYSPSTWSLFILLGAAFLLEKLFSWGGTICIFYFCFLCCGGPCEFLSLESCFLFPNGYGGKIINLFFLNLITMTSKVLSCSLLKNSKELTRLFLVIEYHILL